MAKPTVEVMPEAALADAIRGWKRGRNADAAQSVLGFLGGSVAGPEAQARIEAAGRTAGLDATERAELRRELTDQLVRLQESQAGTRAAEAKARGDIASERARAAREAQSQAADIIRAWLPAAASTSIARAEPYGKALQTALEGLATAPGTLSDAGDVKVREILASLDAERGREGNELAVGTKIAEAMRDYRGTDVPEIATAVLSELGVPSGEHGAYLDRLAGAASAPPSVRDEMERIRNVASTPIQQRQGEMRAQAEEAARRLEGIGVPGLTGLLERIPPIEDAGFDEAEAVLDAPPEAEDPVAARIRQQLEALDQPEPPETVIAWKRQLQNTPTFKRFMEQNSFPDTERGREDAWDAARRAEGLMWRGKAEPSTRTIPDDAVKSDLGMAPRGTGTPDDRARLTPSAELTAGSESGQAVAAPPAAPATRPSARDVVSRIGTGLTAAGQALRGADESQPPPAGIAVLPPPLPTGRGAAAPTIARGAAVTPPPVPGVPGVERFAEYKPHGRGAGGGARRGVRAGDPAPEQRRRALWGARRHGEAPRPMPGFGESAEDAQPESEQAPYLTPEQRRRMTIDARLRALRAAGYAAPTE